ncbi:MAG: GntR family transcriptional regulator [Hyphomicrobiales bacterium]|nr:GntR family transcriptional regulator [Hyphomicrobiales bacterium]
MRKLRGEALTAARTRRARGGLDGAAVEQRVHEALSRTLLEGRLTPGAKLPEHRLAAIFHVSRERVRKVLHRLVAERRLEAIPQRGVFVPKPTVEEIARIYLAHRVFEAGVIAELTRRPNAAILDRIADHLDEERAAVERGDRAASVRLSGEFHLMLVDSLDNPELSRFLRELLARSSLMVSAFEPARLSLCGVDEHAAIAAALRAGDAERAIALSGEHFRHIEERLAQGLVERMEIPIEQALAPAGQTAARKRPSRQSHEKHAHR